ncbi:putative diphosphate--fructose-6-phosphate 1-phosphotransferase [Helianthus debilis subsp. tardiflorus]
MPFETFKKIMYPVPANDSVQFMYLFCNLITKTVQYEQLYIVMVGLVFYGRQSPGGHNVVWGLHEALKIHNPKSVLLGFLGGSDGLFAQKTLEITDDVLATYKNQGSYFL